MPKTKKLILCETCGRSVGPELRGCDRRPQGECDFQVERQIAGPNPVLGVFLLVLALIGLSLGIIAVIGFARAGGVGRLSVAVIGTGGGLMAAFAGMALTFANRIIIYNPESGAMWRRTSALGMVFDQVRLGPLRPVIFDATFGTDLTYPASIGMLRS
ncbi:MAG: hypothetical protein GYB68_04400, partial [Chloroflexi bacterium]|nr:hypothetical protein [Chloroflexota bacterium]